MTQVFPFRVVPAQGANPLLRRGGDRNLPAYTITVYWEVGEVPERLQRPLGHIVFKTPSGKVVGFYYHADRTLVYHPDLPQNIVNYMAYMVMLLHAREYGNVDGPISRIVNIIKALTKLVALLAANSSANMGKLGELIRVNGDDVYFCGIKLTVGAMIDGETYPKLLECLDTVASTVLNEEVKLA